MLHKILFIGRVIPHAGYYNRPLKVKVETEYNALPEAEPVRAKNWRVNYGASCFPQNQCKKRRFDQIHTGWTHRKKNILERIRGHEYFFIPA